MQFFFRCILLSLKALNEDIRRAQDMVGLSVSARAICASSRKTSPMTRRR